MNLKFTILTSALMLSSNLVQAQSKLPKTVKASDRAKLTQQVNDFYKVVDPISASVSPNTVVIKSSKASGNKTLAMGTVTDKGIITKYSEISDPKSQPRIIDNQGNVHDLKILKINKEYDLVLFANKSKLPALKLQQRKAPKVGAFLIAAGAANQSLSFGVTSVAPRSLKTTDRGFLGVIMDMNIANGGGIMLNRVEDRSAASRAGLQAGDVITKVGDKPVTNMLEMRNFLQQQKPGDVITMSYRRDGKLIEDVAVTLGARPKQPKIKRSRMNSMKRMGGKINDIAEGFPEVIQSDMQIKAQHCGAPVVDLDGKFVGIVLARGSRMKSYIIGVNRLAELF